MASVPYCDAAYVQSMFPDTLGQLTADALDVFIGGATAAIETYTRRILAFGEYTEQSRLLINKDFNIVGVTSQWPINQITNLSYQLWGYGGMVSLDPLQANTLLPPERFFYYPVGYSPLSSYYSVGVPGGLSRKSKGILQYTYTAGYVELPEAIKQACAMLALELSMADANPTGASSIQVGAEGAQDSLAWSNNTSRNIERAKLLLNNYVRWE